MRVEACCQALLKQILPTLDPKRTGLCVDVGVGTFAFYCELFAQMGFTTVAMEPCPTDKLLNICQRYPIQLIQQCLSNQVGTQTLHMGQFAKVANSNFSSLAPDWFGASGVTRQVKTLDLRSLLAILPAAPITCFKLDIEGWEPMVIQQFSDLPGEQLPKLVMFEYGGGGALKTGAKGWSPRFLNGTMDCLKTLQKRGYGLSIMVDYAAGTPAKVFDLQGVSLGQDNLFYPNAVYGNILTFYDCSYPVPLIEEICAPYRGGLVNWLVGKLVS
ncbi:MAG: methyltransferase [Leptolyngbyaceae cyanobacterium SM2_3_12]|nr:methyltransferase [Leptolyngbyaceae cyanobacterium SM2_3_12]